MNVRSCGPARLRYAVALVLTALALVLALAGCSSTTGSGAAGGNVQHFNVDLSSGAYVPDQITAKAGVPVRITFGKGQGCVRTLVFPQFNINADMTQGPKTFDLGSLQPGEYSWSCGMNMQHGVLKVQ
jgi:plastocyanin domain-containing protein